MQNTDASPHLPVILSSPLPNFIQQQVIKICSADAVQGILLKCHYSSADKKLLFLHEHHLLIKDREEKLQFTALDNCWSINSNSYRLLIYNFMDSIYHSFFYEEANTLVLSSKLTKDDKNFFYFLFTNEFLIIFRTDKYQKSDLRNENTMILQQMIEKSICVVIFDEIESNHKYLNTIIPKLNDAINIQKRKVNTIPPYSCFDLSIPPLSKITTI